MVKILGYNFSNPFSREKSNIDELKNNENELLQAEQELRALKEADKKAKEAKEGKENFFNPNSIIDKEELETINTIQSAPPVPTTIPEEDELTSSNKISKPIRPAPKLPDSNILTLPEVPKYELIDLSDLDKDFLISDIKPLDRSVKSDPIEPLTQIPPQLDTASRQSAMNNTKEKKPNTKPQLPEPLSSTSSVDKKNKPIPKQDLKENKGNEKEKKSIKEKIKETINFYKNGAKNLPAYAKDYFTKTVPKYFEGTSKEGIKAYTQSLVDRGDNKFWQVVNTAFKVVNDSVKGVYNVAKDFLVAGAKATLAIACCIPGPSAIAAGVINGARIAENKETKETSNPKLKKFLAVAIGATVGGLVGSVAPGVMGVAGAAYDTKRLIEKSADHFEKTQAELKSRNNFEKDDIGRKRSRSLEQDSPELGNLQKPITPAKVQSPTQGTSKG